MSIAKAVNGVAGVAVAEVDAPLVEQLVDGLGQSTLGHQREVALGEQEDVGQGSPERKARSGLVRSAQVTTP